jgi:hypothetical protein
LVEYPQRTKGNPWDGSSTMPKLWCHLRHLGARLFTIRDLCSPDMGQSKVPETRLDARYTSPLLSYCSCTCPGGSFRSERLQPLPSMEFRKLLSKMWPETSLSRMFFFRGAKARAPETHTNQQFKSSHPHQGTLRRRTSPHEGTDFNAYWNSSLQFGNRGQDHESFIRGIKLRRDLS